MLTSHMVYYFVGLSASRPGGGGWLGVESENKAISAFNKDVVEVETELDKTKHL